jgi:hypothetical protein
MNGFSCCQQFIGWSFSFSLPHGQKWDIDATDRHMFDSAETNTIVEYYGHPPSVVFAFV